MGTVFFPDIPECLLIFGILFPRLNPWSIEFHCFYIPRNIGEYENTRETLGILRKSARTPDNVHNMSNNLCSHDIPLLFGNKRETTGLTHNWCRYANITCIIMYYPHNPLISAIYANIPLDVY